MRISTNDKNTLDRNPGDGTMNSRSVTVFLLSPLAGGCSADYNQCFLVRAFAGGLSLETLWRLSGLFLVYECGDIYQSVRPGSFFSAKEPFGWLCSGCDSNQLSGHLFPFSYAGNAF